MFRLLLVFCCVGWSAAGVWGQTRGAAKPEMRLEKLGSEINSPQYDEISPVITTDGTQLFFTRVAYPEFNRALFVNGRNLDNGYAPGYHEELRRVFSQIAGVEIYDPVRSAFNQDIWVAHGGDGQFERVEHPPYPLNNALPNSVCTPTPLPEEYVVINQFDPHGGMQQGFSLTQHLSDGSWTFPTPLLIDNFYTNQPGVGLTMSADGEVIVLSLQRDDSRGGPDLYACMRIAPGHYGTPINLGSDVNTMFRETTPSLSTDKRTLYFSSNRKGRGGNDIYFVKRMDESWKRWSKARRLSPPVSSESDDSQPYFNAATGYLYFTSKRDGSSDIYRIQIAAPEPLEDIRLLGKIIDSSTGQQVGARVLANPRGRSLKRVVESSDGAFTMKIPQNVPYELLAEKPGYVSHPVERRIRALDGTVERELILYVSPLRQNAQIRTEPIYFVRSKATFLPESTPALRGLLAVLEQNPTIKVRIEGHTDNLGRERDLQRLSQQRAESVRTFLVRNGVAADRVVAEGFGSSRPVNDNSSDTLRAENRRVEVRITEVGR